jgi:hypothetical protein
MGQLQSSGGACSTTESTALGVFQGFAGIIGMSSFINPIDSSQLDDARKQLEDTQKMWNQQIEMWKNQVSEDRLKEITSWVQTLQQEHTNAIAALDFKIESDHILIISLILVVFFLFIFDLTLPINND